MYFGETHVVFREPQGDEGSRVDGAERRDPPRRFP